jgi:SRSO17 transposase
VAVSLSLANTRGSVPLDYRLYLPQEWADDRARSRKAGIPQEMEFRSKVQIAREQIEVALAADTPRGIVLADAWYGNEADFRDWLRVQQLDYVLAVRANTSVWWGQHQPVRAAGDRPLKRFQRDARHQPIGVLELAQALPAKRWRKVSWREGTNAALSSRFARVRVRAANDNRTRAEEWLLIEWPAADSEPVHYWLSTLPDSTSFKTLVANAMGRWMIERDYQELKSELGLSHYEGRNWRGFHHHATLCIAAYGFLMSERLRGKKNAARFKQPPLPKDFRPRGAGSDAASPPVVDCHRAISSRARHRSRATAVSVLRGTAG